MKTMILIFIIFTFLSCNKNSQSDKSGEILTVDSQAKTNDELLGAWGIYVIGDAYCNACPQVTFMANGTGMITFPIGTMEQFEWKRKNNRLEIKHVSTSSDNLFQDIEYSMTYSKNEEYLELELTQSTKGSFTLRK